MHTRRFLGLVADVAGRIDEAKVEAVVSLLARTRDDGGRVFFLGVGGSAANASHAVNDFRKLAAIECYAASDNVAELTARTNDEGWESIFVGWLEVSRLSARDALFILSVGGGSEARRLSVNIVRAIEFAKARGARIVGIVGRDGGATAAAADACVCIPVVDEASVTALTESFQSVLLHLMITHPLLQRRAMTWEGVLPGAST